MKLEVFAILLFSFVSPALLGSPCPPPSEIYPCRCLKISKYTRVSCEYHDNRLLEQAFVKMSDDEMIIDAIDIEVTRMKLLNTTFFKDMYVRSATMHGSRLARVDDFAFEGQEESMTEMRITASLLMEIPIKALNILQRLNALEISSSEIAKIPDSAFDNSNLATSLMFLYLGHNRIRSVGSEAFASLERLAFLDLSQNRISNLVAGILPPDNRLMKVNVSSNRLESIPKDVMILKEGVTLDLSKNSITKLDDLALQRILHRSIYVDLKKNPLDCCCNLRMLTTSIEDDFIVGRCTTPPKLSGRKLSSLRSDDFSSCRK